MMVPALPLFSAKELEDAQTLLQEGATLPVDRVIWFRNSLRALLRDVETAQSSIPPVKILAVDTIELVASISYNDDVFTAFTFGGLLVKDAGHTTTIALEQRYLPKAELESVDKLILQHLLAQRDDRYLLLDPHAEEIANLRAARERDWKKAGERLFNAKLKNFAGFDAKNFENILDFIKSGSQIEAPKEWQIFRDNYLPNLRWDMVEKLWNTSERLKSIESLIKDGNYAFLRPPSFGDRSLLSEKRKIKSTTVSGVTESLFKWDEYEAFVETPAVIDQFEEIHQVIQTLISKRPRFAKSQSLLDLAAERDARSFAIIHVLNLFFHEKKINARVELVTRSSALHNVIGSLPDYRFGPSSDRQLHIPVRHPFLLPDIYKFDAQSLAAIGGVLIRLDGLINPYLKEADGAKDKTAHDVGALRTKVTAEATAAAIEAARSVTPWLRDILSIQQGRELSPSLMKEIYSDTVSRSPETHPRFVEKIGTVFRAITEQLRQRTDPLSLEATHALIEENSTLVEFEAARTFRQNEIITFRAFDFRSDNPQEIEKSLFGGVPCLTLRSVEATEPTFNRLILIHSTQMIELLLKNRINHRDPYDETRPTTVRIPVKTILNVVKRELSTPQEKRRINAFEKVKSKEATESAVFNLNATLLASLIFASKRRFETAISLSSTALHQITQEIRVGRERATRQYQDVRLSLAYRELFLLRHYCERGLAMEEYFGTRTNKASVSKNFARAQRDLDFAMLMAEDAECLLSVEGKRKVELIPPAGANHFNDFRLRLAQLSGWADQYLVIADSASKMERGAIDWQDTELQMLRRRVGIWAAASFVKEVITDAYHVNILRTTLEGKSRYERYLKRYLAYIEARALQGALMVFLIFVAHRISPDMLVFWSLRDYPTRDRVLLFREWRQWWNRYSALVEEYKFLVRADALIFPVCKALSALAEIRRNSRARRSSESSRSSRVKYDIIIGRLRNDLEKIVAAKNSTKFITVIAKAMLDRLNELRVSPRAKQFGSIQ